MTHYEAAKCHANEVAQCLGRKATAKEVVEAYRQLYRTSAKGPHPSNVASYDAGYFIIAGQPQPRGRPADPDGELLRGLTADFGLRTSELSRLLGIDESAVCKLRDGR